MADNAQEDPTLSGLDPLHIAQAFMQMGKRTQDYFQKSSFSNPFTEFPFSVMSSSLMSLYGEAISQLSYHPEKLAQAAQMYQEGMAKLGQKMIDGTALALNREEIIKPKGNDRRFKHPAWNENPYFDLLKQSYLLWDQWMRQVAQSVEGLDEKGLHRIDFYTRQISDFFAPSNFLWTNPKALQKLIETGGQSLVRGVENFFRDLEQGQGNLDIKMVDHQAFQLGDNLAVTPGHVIFQNEIMQLIQYTPITSSVYEVPLLLVPPCINKFYIFDLRPENSFVKWCLEQGIQVFIISWVNPDENLAQKTFQDYVFEGIFEATRIVQETTQQPLINAVGFCIGGNILACAAALQASQQKNSFASLTYLATLFDFSLSGDLKVFIDEEFLQALEERMKIKGFMEGKILARTFNFLRANDLIWWFVENNYLLGQEPAAFDLLYWNSDATNVPMSMYTYYLRRMFFDNLLKEPDALIFDGIPLNLRNISTPTYILNTKDDHIAPWLCGYAGMTLFQGTKRFVLGDSGHIAGVFNHPQGQKYCYWTSEKTPIEGQEWLESATPHAGSWWTDWAAWLHPFLGQQKEVIDQNFQQISYLEKAPGSYVMKKSA